MPRLIHLEFAGTDGERLRSFYAALFGAEFAQDEGCAYWRTPLMSADAATIGIRHEPDGCSEVIAYFAVPDVDAAFARAQELGGGIRVPLLDNGDMRFCVVTDPLGNPVGLIQQA